MEQNNTLKTISIVLGVVVVLLLGVFLYVWMDRKQMIDQLVIEKQELTEEMLALQEDYSQLATSNDTLSTQIEREREKVDQLLERLQQTQAANRAKIREYEKELGTLRSIMKHYIVQIDSLNTLNVALRKDAQAARAEAASSKKAYEDLQSTTNKYADQVAAGSVLKGRNVVIETINSANKVLKTNPHKQVAQIKTCLTIIENAIAPKGPKWVYIRVKGPDGLLMTEDSQRVFRCGSDEMIYSDRREIDYEGDEIEVCVYFAWSAGFTKGEYTVDVYTEDGPLGSGSISLR
ncbi:MAG: hypothetical protein HUJ89_00145 [Bacteroidales bacterium]|nr:hypothetical protein [Bacteroidales bacterium]